MNYLKLLVLVLAFPNASASAQAGSNNLIKDSLDVVNLAKKHKLFFNNSPQAFPPMVSFDATSNKWTLTSWEIGYTRKGRCAHTNGCTTMRHVTLVIDAKTGKFIIKEDKTITEANWEK